MRKIALFLSTLLVVLWIGTSPLEVSASSQQPDEEVLAESALLINTDTHQVVYAKNSQERMYPASITKIMTAVVLLESVEDLDATTATASPAAIDVLEGTDSSVAGIQAGDTFTMRQLLYAMMIPSGNDAANVIADALGPGIPDFVEKMNAKAQELGLKNTHFANAHGLFDEQHYTTAEDIAVLAQYAMENDTFQEVVTQTEYLLPATDVSGERLLTTTNQMMQAGSVYYRDYVHGIKTGYLPEAGRCVVSTASQDGYNYLCVVLGAPTDDASGESYGYNMAFFDTIHLYDWAFENFANVTLLQPETDTFQAALEYGRNQDTIQLVPQEELTAFLPTDVTEADLEQILHLSQDPLVAPVQAGDVVGSIEFRLDGESIGSVSLVAAEGVERDQWAYFASRVQQALEPLWVKVVLVLVVLLLVTGLAMAFRNRIKKRKRSRSSSRRRPL